MLSEPQREQLAPAVRTMQIIVGALAFGLLNFMGVVVFVIRPADKGPAPDEMVLTYVSVGLAAMSVLLSFVVPIALAGQLRKTVGLLPSQTGRSRAIEDANLAPLLQMHQTLLIIRCAILEGAGFFNLVAHIIERHKITLAAAGVLLFIMMTQFPTRSRVEGWVENELALAELGR